MPPIHGQAYSCMGAQCFTNTIFSKKSVTTGFPKALEIMENLENHEKKLHAWKNHGILKNLNNHGKIMEFCEII